MADKRITQIATTYDRDDLALATDYLIGDRSGGSSFRILAEEAVHGVLEAATALGVGTDTPGHLLHAYGSTDGVRTIAVENPNAGSSANAILYAKSDSASAALQVFSGANTTTWDGIACADAVRLRAESGASGGLIITTGAAAPIYLGTADTERLTISGAGNIGIGTTSPSYILHMVGDTNGDFRAHIENTNAGTAARALVTLGNGANASLMACGTGYTGVASWQDSFVISTDFGLSGGIKIRANAAPIRLSASAVEANDLLINTSGNVGIGTATIGAKFQVNGAIAIVDGMTAPSTISGYAVIYVDSSTGDLMCKFGDGTTKTIVTDS